jgi:lantibiotic transport system ATP-binding protein
VSTGVVASTASEAAVDDAGEGTLAVSTRGLTKRFGAQTAVDSIDLTVPTGAVYGFLGPNGSGKTTTIRMLLGLIEPTSGSRQLLGSPMPRAAASVLPRVGALVEGPAFHPYLSGRDNLARLDAADRTTDPATARQRIGLALERVGLTAAARKRYRAYSLGMRQRLGLAAALLRDRDLLVLDEPTNGLDPQGTREVRRLVRELASEGATVLVSSHLLTEVEQMCTHVGVMRAGRLVSQGPLETLRAAAIARVRVVTTQPGVAAEVLQGLGLANVTVDEDNAIAELGDTRSELVVERLVAAHVPVAELRVERPDLEEVFVALTGEGFDVEQ